MWGDPIEDETEIKRITDDLLRAYPPRGQDNEPKDSPGPESEEELEKRVAGMYGFDIEGERRREAGFLEALRQRWEAEQRAKTIALIDTRSEVPGETLGILVSVHDTVMEAFAANDAFQKTEAAGRHIRTKIVTLKDQLEIGQAVQPAHLAESK